MCNRRIKTVNTQESGIQFVSERSQNVDWSGIRTVSGKMARIKTGGINLGVGQPDFDTPEHIRKAANTALEEGFTRYPPSKGFGDLISQNTRNDDNGDQTAVIVLKYFSHFRVPQNPA